MILKLSKSDFQLVKEALQDELEGWLEEAQTHTPNDQATIGSRQSEVVNYQNLLSKLQAYDRE